MAATSDLRFVGGRYTVEFSSDATRQAHALDWTELQHIQGALYELASNQGWVDTGRFKLSGDAEPVGANTLRIGPCSVLFEVISEKSLLRVTAVNRKPPVQ